MKPIEPNTNAYRLFINYVLAEVSEEFLQCKDFNFKTIDQMYILLRVLGSGYTQLQAKSDRVWSSFRRRFFYSSVIIHAAKYLRENTEENLFEISEWLFNAKNMRIAPFSIINKLQYLTAKKISNYFSEVLVPEKFSNLLENLVDPDEMPHYTDGNKLYNDQKFYEEFCNNIKENIYKTNSSLIYEILNKADVYYPEDEAELIKRLVEGKIKNEPLSEGESGTETVSPENQIILSDAQQNKEKEPESQTSVGSGRCRKKGPVSEGESGTETVSPENQIILSDAQQNKEKEPESQTSVGSGRRRKKGPVKKDLASISRNETILNTSQIITETSLTKSPEKSLLEQPVLSRPKRRSRVNAELIDAVTQKTPNKSGDESGNLNLSENEDEELDFDKSASVSSNKTPDIIITKKEIDNDTIRSPEKSAKKAVRPERKSRIKRKRPSMATFEVDSFQESSESETEPKSKSKASYYSYCYNSDEDKKVDIKPIGKTRAYYKNWSQLETTYLVLGVELYGIGKWAYILNKFKNNFNSRTSVNLKDRYRTISNNPSDLKRYQSQAEKLKNELKIST